MKAISLWQPWASLIALGEKKWETRSRRIHHRGLIAIHAARSKEGMIYGRQFPYKERLAAHGHKSSFDLPVGVVVAIAKVTDCISTTEWLRLHCKTPANPENDREYCFGNYAPRRFAWKLEDVRPLRTPLPMKGRQSLWTLTGAEEAQVYEYLTKTLFT